jgi:hypothetical protein
MELVSMAREEGTEATGIAMPMTVSPYPYGLRLCLTQEELEKLGYDGLPEAGTIVRIEAVACVTRAASEDPDADGDIDYLCVEMQITELGIEEEQESAGKDVDNDARAGRLYAGKQPA